MTVTLNGEPRELPAQASVADLLKVLDLAKAPCAVEVNRSIVPKANHAAHTLAEGDTIEVVTLVGGG